MGGNADASSQVAHDEIEIFVAFALFASVTSGNGPLVEGMPDGAAWCVRQTAETRFGNEFVHHNGVGRECQTSRNGFGNFGRNEATQVAGVLSLGMPHVVAQCVVDVIHTATDGLAKAATAYHGVEAKGDVVG